MSAPIQNLLYSRGSRSPDSLPDEKEREPPTETESNMTRSAWVWDVKMPPVKKHMKAGHLIPTVKGAAFFLSKHRKVAIEIIGPGSGGDASTQPIQSSTMRQLLQGQSPDLMEDRQVLQDEETVLLRILKEARDVSDSESLVSIDDGKSMSTLGFHGADEEDGLYTERGHYKLEEVKILRIHGRVCEVKLGSGGEQVVRDLKFKTEKDALDFHHVTEKLDSLERERAQRQIQAFHKSRSAQRSTGETLSRALPDLEEGSGTINLLVEIVSATDLPVADISSADPYIICRMGGKEIHRTTIISKDLNPIYTLSKGSLFLLEMSVEEFFSCTGGMSFVVKDYDSLGADEIMGSCTVSLDELLNGKGERKGYEIILEKNITRPMGSKKSTLYLRFKEAAAGDIDFMKVYKTHSKKVGVYADETYLPPRPPQTHLLKRQTKRDSNRELLYRVKPFPDPSRPDDETKWMTKSALHKEAMKPSTSWTMAGSGEIGKLYVEVLGADGLPNMDSATLNVKDKTDAFALLAFEDAIVNTDVIADCLSPRFPPWCRRAFVFNISHPSDDLFVGLFDYDPALSPLQMASRATSSLHDPIARVVINPSKFVAGTTYTLKYRLFYGELEEHREKDRGTMTIRIRLEWNGTREAFIEGVLPPARSLVSCNKSSDFAIAHYTVDGVHDFKSWSMTTFAEHIEELQAYESLVEYLERAAMTVWFWRGHYPVRICRKSVKLPLHSMTAFAWGLLISYDFNFLVAFFAFAVGWFLIACGEYARKNPSPWHQSRSYWSLLQTVVVGNSPAETIEKNQDIQAIEAYNAAVEEERLKSEKEKELEAKQEEELRKEYGDDIEDAEAQEVDITTTKQGIFANVNPLKPILYPVQQELAKVVIALRVATSIVVWEETYYAFWITTLSFLATLVLIWIPWGFLIRWAIRIFVIVFLGPWMAIIDRIYFRQSPDMSEEEKEEIRRQRIKARYSQVLEASTNYQLRKEKALKLKAFKKYMFGKFIVGVPRFCEDLYRDTPLPESFAVPYDADKAPPIVIAERKFGQNLEGDMIPQREIQAAESGKAAKKKKKKRRRFWGKKGSSTERTPLLDKNNETEYDAMEDEDDEASDGAIVKILGVSSGESSKS